MTWTDVPGGFSLAVALLGDASVGLCSQREDYGHPLLGRNSANCFVGSIPGASASSSQP